jgi:hypothetical protein
MSTPLESWPRVTHQFLLLIVEGRLEYITDDSQIAKIGRLRDIGIFSGSGRSQFWINRLQIALKSQSLKLQSGRVARRNHPARLSHNRT